MQAHLARLQEWRDDSRPGARAQRLKELAAGARERLGSMTPPERRAVLDVLDVRATVTGWAECETCEGRGKVRGGAGGRSCPGCQALRRVPSLAIERLVLNDLDLAAGDALGSVPGVPFRLELAVSDG